MSEKKVADNSMQGLSVVDDTADGLRTDENTTAMEEDDIIVKLDDDFYVPTDRDEVSEEHAGESGVEETEEKFNLFDVIEEKVESEKSKDHQHNPTLLLTAEEHLDSTTCEDTFNTSAETLKNTSVITDTNIEESKKTNSRTKAKSEDHSFFWVSNITRQVKAADLKKYFSQIGKVATAKILTNGKNFFGYVSVDTADTAGKCVSQLNNSLFHGKKIVVSKDRPDLRGTNNVAKIEVRKKKTQKMESKKDERPVEYIIPAEEKQEVRKAAKSIEDEDAKTNNVIAELKKKLERSKAEIGKYKYKLTEYQRRHDGMRKKCDNLEKELNNLQFKMRSDRRRLNQDREQFEKDKKMESIRLEADKAVINKELLEVKKLREHLKTKIDELKAQSKKINKRRNSRSPQPILDRSRSPRGRSPLRINTRVGYRSEERVDKKRKREDGGRTPPPPPKLGNSLGKKRIDSLSHRPFFESTEKRSSPLEHGHSYDYRHKTSFGPPQEALRTGWQIPYVKDPRRISVPTGSQSYPPDPPRYNGGYQFPSSSITLPPRSYYPEFNNKPYGQHY